MARTNGTTKTEKVFRQWFAVKNGGYKFSNNENYTYTVKVADCVKSFNEELGNQGTITYPTAKRYLDSIQDEIRENGEYNVYLNEDFGMNISEEIVSERQTTFKRGFTANSVKTHTQELLASMSELTEDSELVAIELGDLTLGDYNYFSTNVDCIDSIATDKDMGIGFSSKNVIIAVGESGVGKSTQLLDMVSMVRKNNPEAKPVYVSVEMMRSDLCFYVAKNPIAKNVPTIPFGDWLSTKELCMKALENIFYSDKFNFIVLDSFQDLLVKMIQVCDMKATEAQNMLLNMMIASAEKFNKTIIAIQHQTKGGDYVGSTLLKHSVTAMLEYRFDGNDRYFAFSKNRRCGDFQDVRVYFKFNKETQTLEYDQNRFDEQIKARNTSSEEILRQQIENLDELISEQKNNSQQEENDELSTILQEMNNFERMSNTISDTLIQQEEVEFIEAEIID